MIFPSLNNEVWESLYSWNLAKYFSFNDHFLVDNGLNYKIPLDIVHTSGPPCAGVTMVMWCSGYCEHNSNNSDPPSACLPLMSHVSWAMLQFSWQSLHVKGRARCHYSASTFNTRLISTPGREAGPSAAATHKLTWLDKQTFKWLLFMTRVVAKQAEGVN